MNTSNTGFKISSYPTALVNKLTKKGKLQYDHYLMSYAETNFGFSTINKNYKIPVESLRRDFMGFLGVENAKGQWRQLQRIWYGDWYAEKEITDKSGVTTVIGDKVNSYLYRWNLNEIGQEDYVLNKFGDETELDHQDKLPTDRIFIVKNAPIPCEYTIATKFKQQKTDENGNIVYEDITYTSDPYPHLTKIVDKDYIDNRFNGIPIIDKTDTVYPDSPANKPVTLDDVSDTPSYSAPDINSNINDTPIHHQYKSTLEIRPYTCIYDYNFTGKDNYVDWIDIEDTLECGNGKTTKDLIKGKLLTFFIRISRPKNSHVTGSLTNGTVYDFARGLLLTTKGIYKERLIDVEGTRNKKESTEDDGEVIVASTTEIIGQKESYYSELVKWAFSGERHQIFKQSIEAERNILIKCQCYYDENDNLCIDASSAVNYEPGTSTITGILPYITNYIYENYNNRVPSSHVLYQHTFQNVDEMYWQNEANQTEYYIDKVNSIHVSKEDRKAWSEHVIDSKKGSYYDSDVASKSQYHFANNEKQAWHEELVSKVQHIKGGDNYIVVDNVPNTERKQLNLRLNVTTVLTNERPDDHTIPTTRSLYDHINNNLNQKHLTDDDRSTWNKKINTIVGDSFLNVSDPEYVENSSSVEINLNTTPDIADAIEKNEEEEDETQKTNLAKTVPTTQGVIDYVKEHGGIKYDNTKTSFGNFRFKGSHVFMIETEDEDKEKVIEFYFGPNNNPPYIRNIQDFNTSEPLYMYQSSKESWKLPTDFKYSGGKDTTYNIVYPVSPTQSFTLKVNNGEEISMEIGDKHPADFGSGVDKGELKQITVSLYKNSSNEAIAKATCYLPILKDENGVFKFDENLNGIGNGSGTDITNKIIVSQDDGICLTLTDLKLNQKEDVDNGFFTGFVRFKATISINKDTSKSNVFSKGGAGSYYLTLTDAKNNVVRSAKDIFIYSREDATSIGTPTVALEYFDNTNTATISGITYYTKPQLKISVSNITGTQQQITKTLNRLNLTKSNKSINADFNLPSADAVISKSNNKLVIQSGNTLYDNAVFQFNNTYDIKSQNDVGCFGTSITAKPYKRDGSVTSSPAGSDSITQDNTKWIWNHSTTRSACNIVSFGIPIENETYPRLLYTTNICALTLSNPIFSINTLINGNGNTFDNECSLTETSYISQLLVQGGWLKYPSTDLTGTYASIQNNTQSEGFIRQYVRKVRFLDSNGQDKESSLGEIEISIDNFKANDFNTSDRKVSLWLAQKYDDGSEPALSLLNATSDLVNASNEIGCAIIGSNKTEGTTYKWKFSNSLTKAWFSGKDYYLIIAMHPEFTGKLGTIKFNTQV